MRQQGKELIEIHGAGRLLCIVVKSERARKRIGMLPGGSGSGNGNGCRGRSDAMRGWEGIGWGN